ncbi:hypothetical protein PCASD_07102 [Puccinia coronata f. sp. avenae]|uniref:Uncharacterized protein n=1 Tax=Puccinia coronata f. sp. avenae TaxID=200324 RepID=A0A2N5TFE9_9BASI|nr:hypothetical protein PCASD_10468 [Puccinia coronata f. sp. avenae]PLW44797.1 hypothetical protein PCASD_07102 [Puccinia coronata f. sp. avenae]
MRFLLASCLIITLSFLVSSLNAVPTPTTRTVELQPGRAESESGSPLDKHGVVDSSGSLGGYVSLATSHTSRDQRDASAKKPKHDS